jgi:hypothetical protein
LEHQQEQRSIRCGNHILPAFSNQTADDIAEVLMNAPTSIEELPNLRGCSIADCAEFVGPVHIFLCGQQTDELRNVSD